MRRVCSREYICTWYLRIMVSMVVLLIVRVSLMAVIAIVPMSVLMLMSNISLDLEEEGHEEGQA